MSSIKLNDSEKLVVAIAALESIAALHLPDANKPRFWYNRKLSDSINIIAEDTGIARTALKDIGV